jgi:hypothetical protein
MPNPSSEPERPLSARSGPLICQKHCCPSANWKGDGDFIWLLQASVERSFADSADLLPLTSIFDIGKAHLTHAQG